jgi:hypothetical protein
MSKKDEPYQFSYTAEKLIGDLRHIEFTDPVRMKKRPTKALSPMLEELLVKFKVGQHSPEMSIRENWSSLVGPAIAAYSHAVSIDEKGWLLVHVSHAVARSELNVHKVRILEKIKALPGCGHIRGVNTRAG